MQIPKNAKNYIVLRFNINQCKLSETFCVCDLTELILNEDVFHPFADRARMYFIMLGRFTNF